MRGEIKSRFAISVFPIPSFTSKMPTSISRCVSPCSWKISTIDESVIGNSIISALGRAFGNNILKDRNTKAAVNTPNISIVNSVPVGINSLIMGPGIKEKIFVLTGTLPNMGRREAQELIEKYGGKTSSSVSKNTDFVLAGESTGGKLDKALKLGIKIINEEEFLKLM